MPFVAALILFFSALTLPDLSGAQQPLLDAKAPATVLLFVRSDCPNTNRYAPEMARLAAEFAPAHVAFRLIYSDRSESVAAIRQHVSTYGLQNRALLVLRDSDGQAAREAQARVTPEAAVFDSSGRLAYHGRIDDRFVSLGVSRPNGPEHHDLESAIQAVLAGRKPSPDHTAAIGCSLADLR